MNPAHRQAAHRVRFDWGPTGAAAIADGADVAVVVDVLSFTTTVTVAVERGLTVWPFAWKDERAAAYAEQRGATLAVGRLEARAARDAGRGAVSLSPADMTRVSGVERVVLPSPNGSSICAALTDTVPTVVAACLRNRTAVAHRLAPRGGGVAVVAAGERWPDGSLRPCAEDLWGAGAVIATLAEHGVAGLSPEARMAAAAFRAVEADVAGELAATAGGRELAAAGFAEDVEVAAAVDVSMVVPVLNAAGAFGGPDVGS
jgi:2-phosphosulfolactate phosphatase